MLITLELLDAQAYKMSFSEASPMEASTRRASNGSTTEESFVKTPQSILGATQESIP